VPDFRPRGIARFVMLAAVLLWPALAMAAPVRIVASEGRIDAPDTIAAGLRHLLYENHGKDIHEAMFVKLPAGMTAADYAAQVKDGVLFPKGALDRSGPGLTSPGLATEIWLRLEAGEYVLLCWHHPRAELRPLHVPDTGARDDLPPKEDVTLRLVDFRFELDHPIHKGVQVLRFEASGPSIHEADIFLLHPGKTAADVRRWYKEQDLAGPPIADALGGILDSHAIGNVVWVRRTFAPGHYVLHCGIPLSLDAKSGDHHAIHADSGMVKTFDIEK